MAQELIISISGMRGIIGANLFPETAATYGAAFGTFLKEQTADKKRRVVAIGRDSRPSGSMLLGAVVSGLASVGVDAIDLGICTTPGVGIMLRHLHCAGGVVITASHNPIEYNGIKLLLDNGIAPPKALAEKIRKIYFEKQLKRVNSADCGQVWANDKSCEIHIDKVLPLVNPAQIAAKKFKVVLDSINGAGGPVGLLLLKKLGCNVTAVNIEPTGIFAHGAEPTEENLKSLCENVRKAVADIGFAQDPDADRLAIVDNTGRYIGEEFTLALAAQYMFAKNPGASAAANLSTSRMIDDIAAAAGGKVIRTPVGEAHVAQAMIQHQCVIGGEGNGGVIDLRVGPIRDSLVAMAMVLQLMAETGKTVTQLADSLGGYTMHKTKYKADAQRAKAIIEKAKQIFPDAKLNTSDGCRFDFADGWLHIRTSNTEPIMRVILETKDAAIAQKYLKTMESICKETLG
ncbi:MAG: phosphoglucosamine mutase [Planctomycetes bacterium]|nr:phosphoglucosamine mutase [Planctomycetota bacterium]